MFETDASKTPRARRLLSLAFLAVIVVSMYIEYAEHVPWYVEWLRAALIIPLGAYLLYVGILYALYGEGRHWGGFR